MYFNGRLADTIDTTTSITEDLGTLLTRSTGTVSWVVARGFTGCVKNVSLHTSALSTSALRALSGPRALMYVVGDRADEQKAPAVNITFREDNKDSVDVRANTDAAPKVTWVPLDRSVAWRQDSEQSQADLAAEVTVTSAVLCTPEPMFLRSPPVLHCTSRLVVTKRALLPRIPLSWTYVYPSCRAGKLLVCTDLGNTTQHTPLQMMDHHQRL